MHHALAIDEILRIFVGYLSKPDQYHLALVCKAFLEPALDAIWHTVDRGPHPLFCLWPDDSIEFTKLYRGVRVPPTLTVWLLRYLKAHDWDRFVYHSKRIRTLKWSDLDNVDDGLALHLFASLKLPESPSILLPNLQSFTMLSPPKTDDTTRIVQLFVSPSLRALHYVFSSLFGQHDIHTEAIIQSIFSRPSITSLSIDAFDLVAYDQHLIKVIRGGGHFLQSVQLGAVSDWEVVEALGLLPSLREMRIKSYRLKDLDEKPEHVQGSSFPALRVIHVEVQVALRILSTINSTPSMTEISAFDSMAMSPSNRMPRLIDLIGSSCPNVRKITFEDIDEFTWQSKRRVPFMPLKTCTNIRHFEYRSTGLVDPPSDDEYAELLQAWPHTQHLQIHTKIPPYATSKTVKLLQSLRKNGPLEFFDIQLPGAQMGSSEE